MSNIQGINLLLHVIVKEGGSRLAAVVTVVVLGHKAPDASDGGVLAKANNLASVLDPVVLEGLEGDGLVGTLDLLGLGVDLLLALLSATAKTEDEVEGGLLLDVVVGQSAAVLQLLASKNQPLLVRGDSFLILDLLFDGSNHVRRLDVEGDGLARQGLGENLHAASNSILQTEQRVHQMKFKHK